MLPYLMYLAAISIMGYSFFLYAVRDSACRNWSYSEYMYFEKWGLGALVAWLVVVLLFFTATCMLYFGRNKKPEQENTTSDVEQIAKLKELLDAGALTVEEFEAEKEKILKK